MSFLSQPITLQSLFGKDRMIDDITVQVVLNESTNDTLTITKQPVQQGASITDHSFKEPTTFSMTAHLKDNSLISGLLNTFSGNGLSEIYDKLLELQDSREPFDVVTPKRIYKNVLMASLGVTTDKQTENILAIMATFQEVLIVEVTTTTIPRLNQKFPGKTGITQKAGKKSALVSAKQGLTALFQ